MKVGSTVGTLEWTMRTGGRLEPAERRRLVADLARVHVANAVGRLSVLARLNPGRNAYVPPARLVLAGLAADSRRDATPPSAPYPPPCSTTATAPTGSAAPWASSTGSRWTPSCCIAAALLHDTGLVMASGRDDFTLTSARVARDVAEQVGLSTAATEILQTAITMHHSPRVTLAAGPVAYLLSAGAGVDVVGLRCWDLPRGVLTDAVAPTRARGSRSTSPRRGRTRPPGSRRAGRRLLRRYGAFTAAVRLAPFDD